MKCNCNLFHSLYHVRRMKYSNHYLISEKRDWNYTGEDKSVKKDSKRIIDCISNSKSYSSKKSEFNFHCQMDQF